MPLWFGQKIQEVPRRRSLIFARHGASGTRPSGAKVLRYFRERKVVRFGSRLFAPDIENATVTERNELVLADTEFLRGCIDPVARAFQLGLEP